MKQMLKLIIAAVIAALIVVVISLLPIGALFKSILYAIMLGLFVYIVALIMRLNK